MLTYAASSTLLALTAYSPMLTYAASSALLASTASPSVLTFATFFPFACGDCRCSVFATSLHGTSPIPSEFLDCMICWQHPVFRHCARHGIDLLRHCLCQRADVLNRGCRCSSKSAHVEESRSYSGKNWPMAQLSTSPGALGNGQLASSVFWPTTGIDEIPIARTIAIAN